MWLIGLLFRDISFGATQFNPQTFLLTFIYGSIATMVILRLMRQKRLRKLLTKILRFYDQHRATEMYKNQKLTILFVTSLILVEDISFIYLGFNHLQRTPSSATHSNWKALLRKLYDFSEKTIPLLLIVMTPACIELQFLVLCAIMRKATEKMNSKLEEILQNRRREYGENIELELVRNRDEQSAIVRLVKATNQAYGFEMFLTSNSLMLLTIYLCNDTLLMLKVKTAQKFSFKVIFNLYSSIVVFCRLACMCYESEKLAHEVLTGNLFICTYPVPSCRSRNYSLFIDEILHRYLRALIFFQIKLTERVILKSDANSLPTNSYSQVSDSTTA